MKVLVTGGAGLIGSHTVDLLLEKGHEVRIFDNLELPTHTAGKPDYLPSEAEFIEADMRDREAVEKALRGMDAVIHLAATGGFTPRIAEYIHANSLGTAYLLESIRNASLPIQKVVVASSIAVYGEGKYECEEHGVVYPGLRSTQRLEKGTWAVPCPACGSDLTPLQTDEDKPVYPATAYALSKYDQERMTLNFGRQTGTPVTALRYFVTYGPRQSLHNPYTGVCTIFASRMANKLPMVIYEDGNQTRDFIFVKDVAAANVFALEEDRANQGVFNVGTGRGTSLHVLAKTLQACLKTEGEMQIPNRYRPEDVRNIVADTTALADIGYQAKTSLEDGLKQYVDWLREQGPLPEYFARAEKELQDAGVVRSVS